MKWLVNIILSGVILFFVNGCGGSSSPTASVESEVNEPGVPSREQQSLVIQ